MTDDEDRRERLGQLLSESHDNLASALDVADDLVHDGRISRRTLDDVSDAITLLESAMGRVPAAPED